MALKKSKPARLLILPATAPAKGKSLNDFCNAHDKATIVPKKIKEGLRALGNSWEYEADFIKRCKLSQTDCANYRDQFAEHWLELTTPRKRIWAGTVAFAETLRAKLQ